MKCRIVISGSTGFLAGMLTEYFTAPNDGVFLFFKHKILKS